MNPQQLLHSTLARFSRVAPRVSGQTAVGRRISSFLNPRKGSVVETVRMRDGSRLILDTRSATEVGSYWTGDYEVPVIRFLKDQLSADSVFLDVGANIGLVTVAIARMLGPENGRVFSFEPVEDNYRRLVQNVELNGLAGTVRTFNFGLGDSEQTALISLQNPHGSSTGNAVLSTALLQTDDPGTQSTIRIRRLDDVIDEIGLVRADLVKVDIEGAEIMFLRGARRFIERFRPTIFGEFNRCFIERFGHCVLDAQALLAPLGYSVFRFHGQGIEKVEQLARDMEELIFVPKERTLR